MQEQAINIHASFCRCCLMGAKETTLVNMQTKNFAYNKQTTTYYEGYFEVNGCSSAHFRRNPLTEYKICQVCMVQLESAFIFRKLCTEANKILENHFTDDNEAGPSHNIPSTEMEQQVSEDIPSSPMIKQEVIRSDTEDENISGKAITIHRNVNAIVQKMKKTRKQLAIAHMYNMNGPPTTPFKCLTCSKSYEFQASVVRHYKIEHEQIRHECKICNIKYKDLSGLWRHSFTHRGFKPYNCPHCDFNSIDKRKFYTHLLKVHQVVYVEAIHGYSKETHAEVLSFVSDSVKVGYTLNQKQ